ncbi:MAG TPA: serine/threonine-protein kinase, partial [Myxococcaceae bacterium]
MTLQPGERFGRYEMVSRLGRGGMAETYRARLVGAEGVTKPVLIKKVLPEYANDQAFTQMFVSEARISATLSHGNIAQVYDFGRMDGEYFLAMEFVEGQPLHRLMKQAQQQGLTCLPAPLAAFIGIEMCRGLHYAHTRGDEGGKPLGIVHRDISPDNVIISYEGQVKIVDFGIAKARELRGFNTEPGVVKGKFLFFSPEQARGEEVDARTDVWATGIVLYGMLCGRLPVQAAQYVAVPQLINGEFPRPRELNPRLPQALEAIVMRALTVDRAQRYESCHAFGEALAGFLYSAEPRFSGMALAHFVQHLFQADLASAGRAVRIPGTFQEQLARWQDAPPGPSQAKPSPRTAVFEETAAPAPRAPVPPRSTSRAGIWGAAVVGAVLTFFLGLSAIALFREEPRATQDPSEPKPLVGVEPPSTQEQVVARSAVEAPPREPVEPAPKPEEAPPRESVAPASEQKPAPAPSPVAREPEYQQLLKQAKTQIVNGRYKAAAADYRAVLALEPDLFEAQEGLG